MLAMMPESARWTAPYFQDLIRVLISQATSEWSSDNIELLLHSCVKAGSPSVVRGLIFAGQAHLKEHLTLTDVADAEWKDGCSAL